MSGLDQAQALGREAVAYRITQGEGRGIVVFACSNVAARRIGANALDEEFGNVSCRRAPEFDGYTPGPVPSIALLENGWWLTCSLPGCWEHAMADEDNGGHIHADPARPDDVYCCAEHLSAALTAPAGAEGAEG